MPTASQKISFPHRLVKAYHKKKIRNKRIRALFSFLLTVLLVFLSIAFLVFASKITSDKIVVGTPVKQFQIVAGQPVEWTMLVERSQVESGKYLASLPKGAKDIKVSAVSAKVAQNILSSEPGQALSLAQRQQLAVSPKESYRGVSQVMFAGLRDIFDFLFLDIIDTTKNLVKTIISRQTGQNAIFTSDATYVDVSSSKTESAEYLSIEYTTPAPKIESEKTENGLQVNVSSGLKNDFEDPQDLLLDVLASTKIPEIYKVGDEFKMRVSWKSNNNKNVSFSAYDTDYNGMLDYIEWTVPHLSLQTFDVIFISKAFRLDSNKRVIEDIYDLVKKEDGKYVSLKNGQYVRVTFTQVLDSTKDNTIYARPTNSRYPATIKVYPVYINPKGEFVEGPLVATFTQISSQYTYRIILNNLKKPTDTFDFKVSGNVDIDFIVDPATEILHYKMNDTSASMNVLDDSGNGRNGTSQRNASTVTVAGKVGSALSFNGGGTASSCSGTVGSCSGYGSEGECTPHSQCSWNGVSSNCNTFIEGECTPSGCSWAGVCSDIATSVECATYTGCSWISSQCSDFNNNYSSCTAQGGCSWAAASACDVYNNNQAGCLSDAGCNVWFGTACSTWDNDQGGCESNSPCVWSDPSCTGDTSNVTGGCGGGVPENAGTCSGEYNASCSGTYCSGSYNSGSICETSQTNCSTWNSSSSNCSSAGCSFDAGIASDYINSGYAPDLSSGNYSISAWINLDTIPNTMFIASLDSEASRSDSWGVKSDGKLYFEHGGADTLSGSTTLNTSTWYFATFVYSSGTMTIYLNGSSNGSISTDNPSNNSHNLWIGARDYATGNNDGFLDGKIDDFRIYNYALTSTQIASLYNSGVGTENEIGAPNGQYCAGNSNCESGFCNSNGYCSDKSTNSNCGVSSDCSSGYCDSTTAAVAYWRMNDNASDTTVSDSSGNGYTATTQRNTNSMYTSSGKISGALNFNGGGSDGYCTGTYIPYTCEGTYDPGTGTCSGTYPSGNYTCDGTYDPGTGTCSGDLTCNALYGQTDCTNIGCSWGGGVASSCSGTMTCAGQTAQGQVACEAIGCTWNNPNCENTPSNDQCSQWDADQVNCELYTSHGSECVWSGETLDFCYSGTPTTSCSAFGSGDCTTYDSDCDWTADSANCSVFADELSCTPVGCSWGEVYDNCNIFTNIVDCTPVGCSWGEDPAANCNDFNNDQGSCSTYGCTWTAGLETNCSDLAQGSCTPSGCSWVDAALTDYINIGTVSFFNLNSYTISAWIYPTSVSGTRTIIGWDGGLKLYVINGKIQSYNGNNAGTESSASISVNRWYHIVMTYDGVSYKYYINNILDTTASNSNWSVGLYSAQIGAVGNGQFFQGKIDDVRIYSYPLVADKINGLYNSGVGSEENGKTCQPGGGGGSYNCSGRNNCSGNGSCIAQDVCSCNTGYTGADCSYAGSGNVSVSLDTTGISGPHYSFIDFDSSLIGWWRGENNPNSELGNNNGTWIGTPIYTTGKFGKALSFDGSSYISLNNKIDYSFGKISYSFWIKPTSDGGIVLDDDATGNRGQGTAFSIDTVNKKIYFAENTSNGLGGNYGDIPSNSITLNEWNFIALTFDIVNGNILEYINGVKIATSSGTTGTIAPSYAPIIGSAREYGCNYGNCIGALMDDLLIFSRILSDSEILSLYNSQANQYVNTFPANNGVSHTVDAYAVSDSGAKYTNSTAALPPATISLGMIFDGSRCSVPSQCVSLYCGPNGLCASGPVCGDTSCNGTELCSTCPSDCGTCPLTPFGAVCGDGNCDDSESCSTCPSDCGTCPLTPFGAVCGDGNCSGSESCSTCSSDCGMCQNIPVQETVTEKATEIAKTIGIVTSASQEQIKKSISVTAEQTKKIVESPEGETVTKTISTTGFLVSTAASVSSFFSLSIFEMSLVIFRLFGFLLTALGLKKKVSPWGVVYDSVTKQPIDPANVILKNLKGEKVASAITDLDGRYGFLVDPGVYKMEVKRTNYAFPSQRLAGKMQDELYANLYFGENINIVTPQEAIIKNIPLDPIKFDWNEFTKRTKNLTKFYSKWDIIIKKIYNFIFITGFIVAMISLVFAPQSYNIIIVALYLSLFLTRFFNVKAKSYGYVVDKKTGNPVPYSIIRVMMPNLDREFASKSVDKDGRYYCLVPPGKYYVKIEKKNEDGSYSLAHTSPIIDVSKKGIIKERFEI